MLNIWLENHAATDVTSTSMPFLTSQAASYGKATNYTTPTHPSLNNYLAAVNGQLPCANTDPSPSGCPISGDLTVMDQAINNGKTAKYYAEGQSTNCQQNDGGGYIVHHNPWAYFTDPGPRAHCLSSSVPMGAISSGNLRTDINAPSPTSGG